MKCDGYEMFNGTVRVVPANDAPPFDITGIWLYRPDVDCWYVKRDPGFGGPGFAESMPPECLTDFRRDDE
jgi:hypothetical protein